MRSACELAFCAALFPPSSPSQDYGSPKIQEALTPDLKRLTRSAAKRAASTHKVGTPWRTFQAASVAFCTRELLYL